MLNEQAKEDLIHLWQNARGDQKQTILFVLQCAGLEREFRKAFEEKDKENQMATYQVTLYRSASQNGYIKVPRSFTKDEAWTYIKRRIDDIDFGEIKIGEVDDFEILSM